MPRKRKTKKKAEPQPYFQAKNKRWYKKIVVDGKTRCRFVSTAEATGQIKVKAPRASPAKPTGTSSPPPPPTSRPKAAPTRKSRRKRDEQEKGAPSPNDE